MGMCTMSLRSLLSRFVRWFVTWPLLVIVAINIESLASIKGLSEVLPENWSWIVSILTRAYEFTTSTWVSYLAIFLLGCIFYEWVSYLSKRMDSRNSKYYRWTTKFYASSAAEMFMKNGYFRKMNGSGFFLEDLNIRLSHFGLPIIPNKTDSNEAINRVYAGYLEFVSSGDFEFAKVYLVEMDRHIKGELQKNQVTEGTAL